MWSGNVLTSSHKVNAFIDPAIYYADPEIELAFISLFATFGDRFFKRYAELHGIRDGFFEVRKDIYALYPLLVHARLFGGAYLEKIGQIVGRLVG
jgi:fructosamine-3-kinase